MLQTDKTTIFGITKDQGIPGKALMTGTLLCVSALNLIYCRENPGNRCVVLTDVGKTRAGKSAPFCVFFAQGRCALVSFHLLNKNNSK